MHTRFFASQTVELAVPEQPVPIQYYLRQPQRVIQALVESHRIEQLSAECFRLKMRPLSFMTLSIQPTVDMRVWADSDGTIHLQSVACEIRGVEYINQRFSLNLTGRLAPHDIKQATYLIGKADLQVQVDLPPPLWLTPKPLLETTGNSLLKSVLMTVKQRLMHQLLLDYREWATVHREGETAALSHAATLFPSPNSPIA